MLVIKAVINNVEKIRKERGLRQAELAEILGVQQSTISHIETRKRNISMPLAIKLAEVLNVTIDELMGGEHDTVSNDPAGGGSAERVG